MAASFCSILCLLVITHICVRENFKINLRLRSFKLNNFVLSVRPSASPPGKQQQKKTLVFLIVTGLKVSIKNVLGRACNV